MARSKIIEIIYMIICEKSLNYELNTSNLTAKIISSPNASGNILIPSSIFYESREYIIESIGEDSFKNNFFIRSIEFSENSKLRSIEKNAFALSNIQSLVLPSTVEYLRKGWCCQTQYLNEIKISPNNDFFRYLNSDHQIIIGKSNQKSDDYDSIVFACRNIKEVSIPQTIKYINSYSFSYCTHLQTVNFSENSQVLLFGEYSFSYCYLKTISIPKTVEKLQKGWCRGDFLLKKILISSENKNFKYLNENNDAIIGKSDPQTDLYDTIHAANRNIKHVSISSEIKYIESFAFSECRNLCSIEFDENSKLVVIGEGSFSFSRIESISIPSSTQIIEKYAFFECAHLKKVQIPNDSKLIKIEKKAFNDCFIQNLFIPSNLKELKEGWNYGLFKLKNIDISSENKNFKYLNENNEILAEKSEKNNEIYDTIIYANHEIKNPLIPSEIKYIKSNSFSFCTNLQTVKFEKSSQLISIGKWSFFASSIEQITIPSNVTKIVKYTFYNCERLKSVDFLNDSKLTIIEDSTFYNSSIEKLTFPSSLEKLDDSWCYNVPNLNNINIFQKNENFKYLDEKHQIVIGKSEQKNEFFDTLVFACRNIEEVFIPAEIKHISSYAFSKCKQIKTIEFSNESKLNSIGKWGFHSSSIKTISIPFNEINFGSAVFGDCIKLKSIEFRGDIFSVNDFLFSSCFNLIIISYPNSKILTIHVNSFMSVSSNCILFINSYTKINKTK